MPGDDSDVEGGVESIDRHRSPTRKRSRSARMVNAKMNLHIIEPEGETATHVPQFQSVLEFIDAMIEEELVQDVLFNEEPGVCVCVRLWKISVHMVPRWHRPPTVTLVGLQAGRAFRGASI